MLADDAAIENAVMKEDLKELRDLQNACKELDLANNEVKQGFSEKRAKDAAGRVERANRHVLAARKHSERLRTLALKVFQDLYSYRGGAG